MGDFGVYSAKGNMRGLIKFINGIRACDNDKQQEETIVKTEMAKIRKKLHQQKKSLDGYTRRKCVVKLLFMYLMGYEADFGYNESLGLLASSKMVEKLMGYITLGAVLNEDHELIPQMIPSIKQDLTSKTDVFTCMALAAASNIGGKQMAEAVVSDVKNILFAGPDQPPMTKKKAAMCMIRINRKHPELLGDLTSAPMLELFSKLLKETDVALLNSTMALLNQLIKSSDVHRQALGGLQKQVIGVLARLIIGKQYTIDYIYYRVPAPWLQVQIFKFLQRYPPHTDPQVHSTMMDIIERIINNSSAVLDQSKNHKNAFYMILFECITLVIKLNVDANVVQNVARLLGELLNDKDSFTNHVYLVMECMASLARSSSKNAKLLKQHEDTVMRALGTNDISIKRRALDLLYGMCDKKNSKKIVGELLNYLRHLTEVFNEEYSLREELLLKIAILAEKYSTNYTWYVDVMLQLITVAGDKMSDAVWYRAIKIITNSRDIQEYATTTIFNALRNPSSNETTIKFGCYILGEYGNLIENKPGMDPITQFKVVQSKFMTSSLNDSRSKAIILSTYIKFVNLYPQLKSVILPIFESYKTNIDHEIQQRSIEYYELSNLNDQKLLSVICDVMPPYQNFTADDGPGDELPPESDDDDDDDNNNTITKNATTTGQISNNNEVEIFSDKAEKSEKTEISENSHNVGGSEKSDSDEENNNNNNNNDDEDPSSSSLKSSSSIKQNTSSSINSSAIYSTPPLQPLPTSVISSLNGPMTVIPPPAPPNNGNSTTTLNSSSSDALAVSSSSLNSSADNKMTKEEKELRRKKKEEKRALKQQQKMIEQREKALTQNAFEAKKILEEQMMEKQRQLDQQSKQFELQMQQLSSHQQQQIREKEISLQQQALKAKEILSQVHEQKEIELQEQAMKAKQLLTQVHQQKEKEMSEREAQLRAYEQSLREKEMMLQMQISKIQSENQIKEQQIAQGLTAAVQKLKLQQEEEVKMKEREMMQAFAVGQQMLQQQAQQQAQQAAQAIIVEKQKMMEQYDAKEKALNEKLKQMENQQLLINEQSQKLILAAKQEEMRLAQMQQVEVSRLKQGEEKLKGLYNQIHQQQFLLQQRYLDLERSYALASEQERTQIQQQRLSLQQQQQALQHQQNALQQQQIRVQSQQSNVEQEKMNLINAAQQMAMAQQQQQQQQKAEAAAERELLKQQQMKAAAASAAAPPPIPILIPAPLPPGPLVPTLAPVPVLPPVFIQPTYQPPKPTVNPPLNVSGGIPPSSSSTTNKSETATNISTLTMTAEEIATKSVRKLTVLDNGVIYEDDVIKIGMRSEYKRGSGRIQIFFINKSYNQTITSLRVLVPPVSYIQHQLTGGSVVNNIPPQGQDSSILIMILCQQPFETYPDMQVSFLLDGISRILKLKLPLAITKFCDPLVLDGQSYIKNWNLIQGKPLEIQEIFKASHPINIGHITELFQRGFRFHILHGVDSNISNILAAGTLHTSTMGATDCLVRLETNPTAQMIRITIKSSNASITSALRNIFFLHLGSAVETNTPNTTTITTTTTPTLLPIQTVVTPTNFGGNIAATTTTTTPNNNNVDLSNIFNLLS
eukprot:TRINITY_DN124_c1_g1_i1.p1 TRINITY_DN124_c1_g1~~TRINITY_DN124_c1_g1_i1.p1  ORF type:complete len:1591 (+),score=529.24 TRINITY_DN124_c1_g1_i1:48-4820(+)